MIRIVYVLITTFILIFSSQASAASGREGYYLGSGAIKSFHFKGDDPLGGGKFTISSGTLFFKVGDGYSGTNANERQRWFEGKCIRSK